MSDDSPRTTPPPNESESSSAASRLEVHLQGETYSADFVWDAQGYPVLYVIGRGAVYTPRVALQTIQRAVDMIDASPFEHVCSVYQMLNITRMPMLARFVKAGSFPSTSKTAHIIIATQNQAIQLAASLSAVLGSKRLRTLVTCRTEAEVDQEVKRWLSLNAQLRAYVIPDR